MTDKKQVFRKLLEDHVGKENAVSHAQLSEALGLSKSSVADLVQELRDEREIPLGTAKGSNSGTFVIQSEDEFREQIGKWNKKRQRITQTIEATAEAWDEFEHDEIDVAPEPETVEQSYPCGKCDSETPRSNVRYPDGGQYDGQPLCKTCYGKQLINRET